MQTTLSASTDLFLTVKEDIGLLGNITPLILTYNEAPNIERSLRKLTWANRIVVIDSYSADNTLEILSKYPQVEVFQRTFDTHTHQWNYGLDKVKTDWVLSLDADYVLTDELVEALALLRPKETVDGYFVPFQYCVYGRPLRGTILPPRQMLFRKSRSTYVDDGHTQLLRVEGDSDSLKETVLHDDRKSLSRWLWAQDRYMIVEAKKILESSNSSLSFGDKLRKLKIVAPFVVFFYCLVLKRGVFDGWRGWYYALQRMFAEILLSIRLIEIDSMNKSYEDKQILRRRKSLLQFLS